MTHIVNFNHSDDTKILNIEGNLRRYPLTHKDEIYKNDLLTK